MRIQEAAKLSREDLHIAEDALQRVVNRFRENGFHDSALDISRIFALSRVYTQPGGMLDHLEVPGPQGKGASDE